MNRIVIKETFEKRSTWRENNKQANIPEKTNSVLHKEGMKKSDGQFGCLAQVLKATAINPGLVFGSSINSKGLQLIFC